MGYEVLCRKRGAGKVFRKTAGWVAPDVLGEVWGIGSNFNGPLARPTSDFSTDFFVPMPLDKKFAKIAAGFGVSIGITRDGTVYGCGWDGAFGVPGYTSYEGWVEVPLPEKIIDAQVRAANTATYGGSTMYLGESGTVYVGGYNKEGHLGLGADRVNEMIAPPEPIATLPPIVQMSRPSFNGTLFLTAGGTAYGCGQNSLGTLGLGEGVEHYYQYSPVLLPIDDLRAVFSGPANSFFIKNNGDIHVSGNGSMGELGLGYTYRTYSPMKIEGLSSVKFAATFRSCSYFLLDDGSVYACGAVDPRGDIYKVRTPQLVPGISGVKTLGMNWKQVECLLEEGGVYWLPLDSGGYQGTFVLISTIPNIAMMATGGGDDVNREPHSIILI